MNIKLKINSQSYNNNYDILLDNKTIGWISYREVSHNSINISSINIDYKYRKMGIGTTIINNLLEQYEYIFGTSSPLAIQFWIKQNAIFEYDVINTPIDNLLNMNEFPTFFIKKIKKTIYKNTNILYNNIVRNNK